MSQLRRSKRLKAKQSAPSTEQVPAAKEHRELKKKVRFTSVDIKEFSRMQARDKVPSDGHGATLGLGAPTRKIKRKISEFESERSGTRVPAKTYHLTKKLSFNTRKQLLMGEAVDNNNAKQNQKSSLRREQSIKQYGAEVKAIEASRAKNTGCDCRSGAQCHKASCLCTAQGLPCLWDVCACQAKRCKNALGSA